MKIYCSRYDKLDPRKYAGKDVWVHCLVYGDEGWARIGSISSDNEYVWIEFVLDYTFRNSDIDNEDALLSIAKYRDVPISLADIDITEPLIMFDMAEFLDVNNLPTWRDFLAEDSRS